jgi:coproporphyrinogen III oxidase
MRTTPLREEEVEHRADIDPLQSSIEKWEYITHMWKTNPKQAYYVNFVGDTCSLCVKYFYREHNTEKQSCTGCPLDTANHNCNEPSSLWNLYREANRSFGRLYITAEQEQYKILVTNCINTAQAMLDKLLELKQTTDHP